MDHIHRMEKSISPRNLSIYDTIYVLYNEKLSFHIFLENKAMNEKLMKWINETKNGHNESQFIICTFPHVDQFFVWINNGEFQSSSVRWLPKSEYLFDIFIPN